MSRPSDATRKRLRRSVEFTESYRRSLRGPSHSKADARPGFWAEITGDEAAAETGPTGYSWKRLQNDGAGALEDDSDTITGTGTAFEVNDSSGVSEGSRVWLRFAGWIDDGEGVDVPLYLFALPNIRIYARCTAFDPSTAEFSFVEINADGSDLAGGRTWDGGTAPNLPKVKNYCGTPVECVGQRRHLWSDIDTSGETPVTVWYFDGLKLNEPFRFDATQVGGSQASGSSPASWTYDIKLSGTTILTAEDPATSPHDFARMDALAHQAATKGIGYYTFVDPEDEAPTLIIHSLNEVPLLDPCLEEA